jgi:hypothetical protein
MIDPSLSEILASTASAALGRLARVRPVQPCVYSNSRIIMSFAALLPTKAGRNDPTSASKRTGARRAGDDMPAQRVFVHRVVGVAAWPERHAPAARPLPTNATDPGGEKSQLSFSTITWCKRIPYSVIEGIVPWTKA